MANFMHPEKVNLDDLIKRIIGSDLIPSRVELLEGLSEKMQKIAAQGINMLDDLQKTLRNTAKMASLAKKTGIDLQYLLLLRREIESYTPKPFKLIEMDWLPRATITKLVDAGLGNSNDLHVFVNDADGMDSLVEKSGVDVKDMEYLVSLANLTKIQWVSLNFARMLYEAGYTSAGLVAKADAETLCERLERINVGGTYFNGKIGLRDVKRLIQAAVYVL